MSRATQIERTIAKGQLVPLTFTQDAVAASQTDAQLSIMEAAASVLGVTEYITPWEGEIVGVSVLLEGVAATAGALDVGPTLGGTEQLAGTVNISTLKTTSKRILRGKIPFEAGTRIGCEISTSGDWDGTGLDIVVQVWVLVHLEGI